MAILIGGSFFFLYPAAWGIPLAILMLEKFKRWEICLNAGLVGFSAPFVIHRFLEFPPRWALALACLSLAVTLLADILAARRIVRMQREAEAASHPLLWGTSLVVALGLQVLCFGMAAFVDHRGS